MEVKVRHPIHPNVMTYVGNKTVTLHNHEGWTDLDTAITLIDGPFGYEWGAPVMPFNPETWTKENKIIFWNYIMPFYEGYGYVAQMMLWALLQNNVDARVFTGPDYNYLKSDLMQILYKERRFDTWGVWHHFWMKPEKMPFEKKAMYTMWESTKLLPDWPGAANSVDILFVPSEENVRIFRDNGVTRPIYVVEHGVDQEFYFEREKTKKDHFVFGTMGSLVPRKNPELLIRAFLDEFGNSKDVKLIMKDTNENTEIEEKYKHHSNIQFIGQKTSPMEIGNLLGQMDVAVFPSCGEGFGLGGLQAMGTGTACICTGWNGFKQYLNPEYNYELEYKLINIDKVPSNNTFYSGQWAEADYDHLRHLLRYTFEHPEETREKGRKAAQWVREYWTWKRCGQQLIDAIDNYENKS